VTTARGAVVGLRVRLTTAFNRILQLPGASVRTVAFTDQGIVMELRRRRRLERGFGALLRDPDDVAGVVVGHDGQEPVTALVGDLVDPDAVQVVQAGVVDVVDHDRGDDRVDGFPGAAQQPAMLVLSVRCASQATTFSKSLVCRAFGRAQGTCSVRTRPQPRQSMRWMSASSHTGQAPKSKCRQRRREES
jgi:hypothetical protein